MNQKKQHSMKRSVDRAHKKGPGGGRHVRSGSAPPQARVKHGPATRAVKSYAAVGASLANSSAELLGAADALRELKADLEGSSTPPSLDPEVSVPSTPVDSGCNSPDCHTASPSKSESSGKDGDDEDEPLNSGGNYCDEASVGDYHVYTDSTAMWCPIPFIVVVFVPFCLCMASCLGHITRFWLLVYLSITVVCQSLFYYVLARLIWSDRHVAWLRPSFLPPASLFTSSFTGRPSAGLAVRAIRKNPEFQTFFPWGPLIARVISGMSTHLTTRIASVSGACYYLGSSQEPITYTDVRVPSFQGNKASNVTCSYDIWSVASFATGNYSIRVTSPAVVTQLVPRLMPLSVSDRELQSVNMARNVTNLVIRANLFSEVARGSAYAATDECLAADVSSGIYKQSRRWFSMVVDPFLAYCFCFLLVCFAPRMPAAVDFDGLTFVNVVLIAPVLEEICKSFWSYILPGGRMTSAAVFGVIEYAMYLHGVVSLSPAFVFLRVPALLLHFSTGLMKFRTAVLTHFLFNATCMAFLYMGFAVDMPEMKNALKPTIVGVPEIPDSLISPLLPHMPPADPFWRGHEQFGKASNSSYDLIRCHLLNTHPSMKDSDRQKGDPSVALCLTLDPIWCHCAFDGVSHLSCMFVNYTHYVAMPPRQATRQDARICVATYGLDGTVTTLDPRLPSLTYCNAFSLEMKKCVMDMESLPDCRWEKAKWGWMYDFGPAASLGLVLTFTLLVSGILGTASMAIYAHALAPSSRPEIAPPIPRRYAAGYRVTDYDAPEPGAHGAKIRTNSRFFEDNGRPSFACTLGFAFRRIVPPFPDFSHAKTALHGCLMRFCRTPPTPDKRKIRLLRRFVKRYCRDNLNPIPPDADLGIDAWLEGTHYPEWRKDQLRSVWNNEPWLNSNDQINKGFVKKETYGAYKPSRGINSRSDKFKVFSGRYFKLMETELYRQPCLVDHQLTDGEMRPFIKHVPIHLRPEFITRMIGSSPGPFYETDYSQFEKHFTPDIMESLELVLYRHMMVNFPDDCEMICDTLTDINRCVYRGFVIRILGRRMSGDMCTSLGNGFSNLMLFMFAAHIKGGNALGVVEGDDALFVSTVVLTKQDFYELGFEIKVATFTSVWKASFCGMLMSQDGVLLRDISRVLPKFAWSFSPRRLGGPKVVLGLLRARALSLAYESPRCPIIAAFAKRALSVTAGTQPIFEAGYHDQLLASWADTFSGRVLEDIELGPSLQSRVDFADKFGIDVPCQLRAEEIFSRWDGSPLDHPFINSLFPEPAYSDFAERFTADRPDVASELAAAYH